MIRHPRAGFATAWEAGPRNCSWCTLSVSPICCALKGSKKPSKLVRSASNPRSRDEGVGAILDQLVHQHQHTFSAIQRENTQFIDRKGLVNILISKFLDEATSCERSAEENKSLRRPSLFGRCGLGPYRLQTPSPHLIAHTTEFLPPTALMRRAAWSSQTTALEGLLVERASEPGIRRFIAQVCVSLVHIFEAERSKNRRTVFWAAKVSPLRRPAVLSKRLIGVGSPVAATRWSHSSCCPPHSAWASCIARIDSMYGS